MVVAVAIGGVASQARFLGLSASWSGGKIFRFDRSPSGERKGKRLGWFSFSNGDMRERKRRRGGRLGRSESAPYEQASAR